MCKLVILDSGFCVLKAIIELRKIGIFASAVIKKRKYWPKLIPGDKIKEHFKNCIVGDVDARSGREKLLKNGTQSTKICETTRYSNNDDGV